MSITIGITFEMSENPHYRNTAFDDESSISELVKPSEIERLRDALEHLGYATEDIDGPWGLLEIIDRYRDSNNLIFNKCRGFYGLERKIFVPSICKLYNIRMIGSSAYVMTLARHKYHSNKLLAGLGLLVPKAKIFYPGDGIDLKGVNLPLIIKPNHESGALGIDDDSVHNDMSMVKKRIRDLQLKFHQPVIVEDFIAGEEWKVPVIGSLQTRCDLLESRIEYYEPMNSDLLVKAMAIAKTIHDVFQCNDYSRIDFRINGNSELVFMELSTHPDISVDSSFINAALQQYDTYEMIINTIVDACKRRCGI